MATTPRARLPAEAQVKTSCRVLVRGSGDIGSAVAHALVGAGCRVVVHDDPAPSVTRRAMAFADALFDGRAVLAGLEGRRLDDFVALGEALTRADRVSVTSLDLTDLLAMLCPQVLVDARMRKRQVPEDQRALSALTVGLGPNFVAGGNVHLAVETAWEGLGEWYVTGATRGLVGEPRRLGGHARERYVYAPIAGHFMTTYAIGETVAQGEPIAHIDEARLTAPLSGRLRGLTRSGVEVTRGTKVVEVDPRGEQAQVTGIAERPAMIAAGVLEALHAYGLLSRAGQDEEPP